MTDLPRLRELADKATPGPWKCMRSPVDIERVLVCSQHDEIVCSIQGTTKNQEFIASANPEAIIALIDELEKTKAQLAEANEVLKFYGDKNNWMTTRKDELHEARMTIIQDPESFGQYDESWSVSTLLLIGGKRARQYLEKFNGGKI